MPPQITVTVTPGLPPPLDGESYECYFTAADGTPFSTDALEVMTNTTYVCNITEVVPDFQGASLGMCTSLPTLSTCLIHVLNSSSD